MGHPAVLLTTERTLGCLSHLRVMGHARGMGFNDILSRSLEPFRRQTMALAA